MRRITYGTVGLLVLSTTLALAGCSGSSSSSPGSTAKANTGKSLTVWMMDGDLSSKTLADVNKRFKAETGVKPDVQIQQWTNINTKLTTALSQKNPPDVVDIGNTDVPFFASGGALADLTSNKQSLDQGMGWLSGLAGPATIGGKLYAVPLFAGNRAVIYNKKMWTAAGITSVPTTWVEFTSDLNKIKAQHPSPTFSAMYLGGGDWQTDLQFVFDAGGKIAQEENGKWAVDLDKTAAVKGFQQFKSFEDTYSTVASQTGTEYTPDPNAIFGKGDAATVANVNLIPSIILSKYPALKGEIGTFPMPSQNNAGQTMPVFLGGSDLGIANGSTHKALALKYVKLLASPAVQEADVVGIDGWTPNSTQLINQTIGTLVPLQQPFFTAAKNSEPTPAAAGWATVENNLYMQSLFEAVATGKQSIPAATKEYSQKISTALNTATQ